MLRDHSPDASPSKLLTAQEPIPASRVGHQDHPFIHVICALAGTTTTLRLCITMALHSSGSYRFDTLGLLHVSQCIAVDILCITASSLSDEVSLITGQSLPLPCRRTTAIRHAPHRPTMDAAMIGIAPSWCLVDQTQQYTTLFIASRCEDCTQVWLFRTFGARPIFGLWRHSIKALLERMDVLKLPCF